MTSLINTLSNSWTCRTVSPQRSLWHIFNVSGEICTHLSLHLWLVTYGARLQREVGGVQIKSYQRNPVGAWQLIVRPWSEVEALLLPADKVAPLRSAEPLHLCTSPLGEKKKRGSGCINISSVRGRIISQSSEKLCVLSKGDMWMLMIIVTFRCVKVGYGTKKDKWWWWKFFISVKASIFIITTKHLHDS